MAGTGTHTAAWIAAWIGGGCTLVAALIGAYATLAAQGFLRLVSTKGAGNVGMQIDAVIWEH
ncbi:hypothetical protein ACFOY2_46950 [Nonomuraea purpurea]|uniref:Ammonium transporter AmtB-like domain-containing protein n=1 Tax=Nonomuraea purpurea TaxID=1849276 RepID=A0ABV8GPI4_9ACTN